MLNFTGIAVFVTAATAGSLSAASRRLSISPMAATRGLASLERDLGVRLVQRTTRSVSLTAEGEAFLPYATTIFEAAEAGRAELAPSKEGPTGTLRVTSAAAFGRAVIMPLVPELLRRNPGLRIDLLMTDTMVNVVSSGVDVAIRIADLKDPGLVAMPICRNPRTLCASPTYLARQGAPIRLSDLPSHDCITASATPCWRFMVGDREQSVRVAGRFAASHTDGVRDACLQGLGLAVLSNWHAQADLRTGQLVEVTLADASPKETGVSALYPTNRQILPKVKIFVAAVRQALLERAASYGS